MGCCSSASVLMDATFTVDADPTTVDDFLRAPDSWLHIIPGVPDTATTTVDTAQSFVVSAPLVRFANIAPSTPNGRELEYDIEIGENAATMHVAWTFERASGDGATTSTHVHRRITNFQAVQKRHLPWTPVMRDMCKQENAAIVALFLSQRDGQASPLS